MKGLATVLRMQTLQPSVGDQMTMSMTGVKSSQVILINFVFNPRVDHATLNLNIKHLEQMLRMIFTKFPALAASSLATTRWCMN